MIQPLCRGAHCIGSAFIMWHIDDITSRASKASCYCRRFLGIKRNAVREECERSRKMRRSFFYAPRWVTKTGLKSRTVWLKGWDNIGYFCVAVLGHKEHIFSFSVSLSRDLSRTNDVKPLVRINFALPRSRAGPQPS